jgi:hypothetical protein
MQSSKKLSTIFSKLSTLPSWQATTRIFVTAEKGRSLPDCQIITQKANFIRLKRTRIHPTYEISKYFQNDELALARFGFT